jgi:hypothetical protein
MMVVAVIVVSMAVIVAMIVVVIVMVIIAEVDADSTAVKMQVLRHGGSRRPERGQARHRDQLNTRDHCSCSVLECIDAVVTTNNYTCLLIFGWSATHRWKR